VARGTVTPVVVCRVPHRSTARMADLNRHGDNGETVGDVSYISKVRIERLGGPQRLAYLPAEESPVTFGVHSEVAEHYGVDPERYPPHATTLDYVVAAAAG
jgi:hypothetical protein